ncbi:polyprenyl synthetase family protein [Actinoplanes sp. NPDC049265]|uniref:polyprenyl synthetase family protein n=1 Tax=Actinoplanes sp. NPDC049265 TaxID=3363902 RepID=UPI0037157857
MSLLLTGWPGAAPIRERVGAALDVFLAGRTLPSTEEFRPLPALVIAGSARGGRRTRSLACAAGAFTGGADPLSPTLVKVGAALELFGVYAEIHAGVRHRSSAVQRELAAALGDPAFGTSGAILLGDLCLVWSQELLESAGLPPAARPIVSALRTEAIAGQYLDADESLPPYDEARAWKVTRLSASVPRPLQLGATLAGAPRSALALCAAYGTLAGEALQLRDDLHSAFGDTAGTAHSGDPRGGVEGSGDLRDGRRTVLMALAWRHADEAQRRVISALHGCADLDDEGVRALRAVIRATGADRMVADLIADRTERAMAVVRDADLPGPAALALGELVFRGPDAGR